MDEQKDMIPRGDPGEEALRTGSSGGMESDGPVQGGLEDASSRAGHPAADRDGAFAQAFFLGSVVALLGSSCALPAFGFGDGIPPRDGIVWVAGWCFIGGFLAGASLRPGLRSHRWLFLWLAAGSPALVVWLLAIMAVLKGWPLEPALMAVIVLLCVASVAGSVVGYHFQDRVKPLLTFPASPRAVFRFFLAMLTGTVAALVSAACLFMVFYGLLEMTPDLDVVNAVASFALYGLPPFAGGFVSGLLMKWLPPDTPRRRLVVAAASPAFPTILVGMWMFGGMWRFLLGSGAWLLPVGAGIALPVTGALAGYGTTFGKRDWSPNSLDNGRREDEREEPPDSQA